MGVIASVSAAAKKLTFRGGSLSLGVLQLPDGGGTQQRDTSIKRTNDQCVTSENLYHICREMFSFMG